MGVEFQAANTEAAVPAVPGHGRDDVLEIKCVGCGMQWTVQHAAHYGLKDGQTAAIAKSQGWHHEEDTWLCPDCVKEAKEEAEAARQ
jgi:hypothetical protein